MTGAGETLSAISSDVVARGLTTRRVLPALIAASVAAFAAFLLLSAFGDDWRSGADGGAHALSVAGTGFRAVAALDAAARGAPGTPGSVSRDLRTSARASFLVLTPNAGTSPAAVKSLLAARGGRPTLIVLGKWLTQPIAEHRGWVRAVIGTPGTAALPLGDLLKSAAVAQRAAKRGEVLRFVGRGFEVASPATVQTIAGKGLMPLLVTGSGAVVLGRLPGDAPVFVLADPDLIDNAGVRTLAGARAAIGLLDQLPRQHAVTFDVTLNGFERSRNLLRLAFTPPFLPATLCLALAAGLAALHALARFGSVEPPARALAWGSAALVDNAADLVRQARREPEIARRYADQMREAAVPRGLGEAARDTFLAHAPSGRDWPRLALAAGDATTPAEALAAARALHAWRGRVTG